MTSGKGLFLLGFLAAGALAGCAGGKSAERGAQAAEGSKPQGEAIQPERSGGEKVTEQDVNGDGKPDVWTYTVTEKDAEGADQERRVRQELDLNWDGRVDLTRYFDANGDPARETLDLDYDGKVDASYFFEKGVNTRRERDVNGDGRMDSFIFYERGTLARKERDTNADGKVDYWEYWENGQVDRIGEDLDGDGTVDKWTRNPNNAASE
ncbi:hypothetical protein HPC49_33530 [Pyxidicoccus fallax]|uniref:Lipoprotein n=1 Tax=Pyxidicoccus fallax TaxID=394095 RepID=A0A848LNT1_9BACT|nr:hypothetical protein [Pyxidicoccus fallax]NMO19263.1 hypothetical protein [Pyxidicoccus fallax]NPC83130.1 hypothetical protein [Pyxidicoccus fallax]